MSLAAAAQTLEVHGIVHSPHRKGFNSVAGLVRRLIHAKTLAAVLEHLGHERQPVQALAVVQRLEDLLDVADLNPLPGSEVQPCSCRLSSVIDISALT